VDSIAAATEIPRQGEEWFKVQRFKSANCDDFLLKEHKGADLTDGVQWQNLENSLNSDEELGTTSLGIL